MDDDGAPIWPVDDIEEEAAVIGEAMSLDETEFASEGAGEASNAGDADSDEAAPRPRRRSPRRSRAKRTTDAETAASPEALGDVTDVAVPAPEVSETEAVGKMRSLPQRSRCWRTRKPKCVSLHRGG